MENVINIKSFVRCEGISACVNTGIRKVCKLDRERYGKVCEVCKLDEERDGKVCEVCKLDEERDWTGRSVKFENWIKKGTGICGEDDSCFRMYLHSWLPAWTGAMTWQLEVFADMMD